MRKLAGMLLMSRVTCFGVAGLRVWNSLPPHLRHELRDSSINWKHFCLGVSQPRRIV